MMHSTSKGPSPPGRFIVVEGLDGSGKSTLADGLATQLGAVSLATPGAELQPLRAGFHEAVSEHPEAMVLFYAASCLAMGEEALRVTATGRDVVMDRYLASTLAYGLARGASLTLHDVVRCAPAADLTVLLAIDEEERRRRLTKRGANAYDQETLQGGFADEVMASYRRLLAEPFAGCTIEVDERVTAADLASLADSVAIHSRSHAPSPTPPASRA